ncbi:MAG: DNA cytosine methyltransferase [Candidatus Hodarchaeota archaeon]
MSFPDSFTFHGTFSQISLQIGNAVAPLDAREIGVEILRGLENYSLPLLWIEH